MLTGSLSLGPPSCLGGDAHERCLSPLDNVPAGLALAVSRPVLVAESQASCSVHVLCRAPAQQPSSRGRVSE